MDPEHKTQVICIVHLSAYASDGNPYSTFASHRSSPFTLSWFQIPLALMRSLPKNLHHISILFYSYMLLKRHNKSKVYAKTSIHFLVLSRLSLFRDLYIFGFWIYIKWYFFVITKGLFIKINITFYEGLNNSKNT